MLGIGSDHLGYRLKRKLRGLLRGDGVVVQDFGTYTPLPADYPDIAVRVARAVQAGRLERAVLICSTGLGMAIAANKITGVYAAPVWSEETARAARVSNNAQVIALGAAHTSPQLALRLVSAWLRAEFRGGRSARKLRKIHEVEQDFVGIGSSRRTVSSR